MSRAQRQPVPQLRVVTPEFPAAGAASWATTMSAGPSRFTGAFELSVPIEAPSQRFAPTLALVYSSRGGDSPFGRGMALSLSCIARKTSNGVPRYDKTDVFVLDGAELVAHASGPVEVGGYPVTLYYRGDEGAFDRIEHHEPPDRNSFWQVFLADGRRQVYGHSQAALLRAHDNGPRREAQWWLEEEVNPHGEHIHYAYGVTTRTLVLYYPRRPIRPPQVPQQQADRDDQQGLLQVEDTGGRVCHLTGAPGWPQRLGIPVEYTVQAFIGVAAPTGASPIYDYEFLDGERSPLTGKKTLRTEWQRFYYAGAHDAEPPFGVGTMEALLREVRTAVMSRTELHGAFNGVTLAPAPDLPALERALKDEGGFVFEFDHFWQSVRATYHSEEGFFRIGTVAGNKVPEITYYWDHDGLHILEVKTADGVIDASYDPYCLKLNKRVDVNENTHEARYDALGRLKLSTFYGTESNTKGIEGFGPLEKYESAITTLSEAIEDPKAAIHNAARACFYDDGDWPAGPSLDGPATPVGDRPGARAPSRPAHMAELVADSYFTDPLTLDKAVRVVVTHSNGFGGPCASAVMAEEGSCFLHDPATGGVKRDDMGQPLVEKRSLRWIMKATTRASPAGLALVEWLPYYLDTSDHVPHLQLAGVVAAREDFFDGLSRLRASRNFAGGESRISRHPWYVDEYDENDAGPADPAGENFA